MPPAKRRVADVDDAAAGPARMSGGATIFGFIDEQSLNAELIERNPNHGPHNPHPFSLYVRQVIARSGVHDARETREMASHICGIVARLPFLPDDEIQIDVLDSGGQPTGKQTTEFEQQIVKTARRAEEALESEMVWSASALKIARAALELRRDDPKSAWINDPLPGEPAIAA